VIRALRVRRGWTQAQLAAKCGLAQTEISKLERGHVAGTSARTLRRVCAPLEADVDYEVRWRAGALDRLLDRKHSELVEAVVRLLIELGWEVLPEVSFSHFGERGSIDVLAWRGDHLLVIEVKGSIEAIEETLRRLDAKLRLAPAIARERAGIRPRFVSMLLVVGEGSTARRRVEAASATFGAALPARGRAVTRWLANPEGQLRGLIFLSPSTAGARKQRSRPRAAAHRPIPSSGNTASAGRQEKAAKATSTSTGSA
jgi:transcriptional regulator with XRE-family HTH domain